MIFSSLLFLYAFLPLVLVAYYLAPAGWRNGVALAASLFFFAWGEPLFVFWLVASSLVDHRLSLRLASLPQEAGKARKRLLLASLVMNLGALGYFKYANFFVGQVQSLSGFLGWEALPWAEVALPIGISFFTFHKVSYLLDVHRGVVQPTRSAGDFLLYVCLFPQLVAGPIVRYRDIAGQINGREHTVDRFLSGIWRFLLGLGRKVLIANPLGQVADTVFSQDIATLPVAVAWLGLLAYAFQIYFDFAGYSDMAIGLGRMLGFEFLENFNRPYAARSVTEFWRRWHISLSNFMRDYLYVPLGGNRVSPARAVCNLWIVFLLSGLWHGASWNFILWGAWHGALLSAEKFLGAARLVRVPAVLGVGFTFLAVLVGWVFFRVETLSGAVAYLGRLVEFSSWEAAWENPELPWPELLGSKAAWALGIAAVASFLPDRVWKRLGWEGDLAETLAGGVFRTVLGATILILATAALVNQSYNPFIYFRF